MNDRAIADDGLLSDCHGDTGHTGRASELMGNFPHGPTHGGVINAARAFSVMASVVETA